MLSAEINERLTQVGPGTPMGEYLRRYWRPIGAESQFPEPGARAVRLLGEDLVLYKDLSGNFGLIDRHCPHRRADLSHGIAEKNGLRCNYHGWSFNASGQCVEQPFEDTAFPERNIKCSVKTRSYPVELKAGLVWA